ncbi:MAG: response regulator transcription factor [candidate division NC10 bacterium]|nr:response regulator transcription factor [candidate division NC10 bacterium]MDE2321626.1 response regulator transcription factor [candidate division NC10 bacterium]
MPPIRVIVAEDYLEYRELLCEQLRVAPDLDVVGEARDGWEAITAVGRLKPDVLILDLDLQGMSGLDVLHVTRWYSPDTKAIILSVHDEESIVQEVLRQGARGYIVKGDGTDLVKAIRVVHNGEVWVRRRVLTAIIDELRRLVELTFPATAAEHAPAEQVP